jgi:predicted DNA binding CopG/RHH family protein
VVSKKDIRRVSEDIPMWENKQLGASAEHARASSVEQQHKLDEATGLQLLSIRMPKLLIEQIKQLAKLDGLGYQPYMRKIIAQHVRENEHKLKTTSNPLESIDKADKLFAQALVLKAKIPLLETLTSERILAEANFSRALSDANTLFGSALVNADPILRRHVELRLSQINEIISPDLNDPSVAVNAKRQTPRIKKK